MRTNRRHTSRQKTEASIQVLFAPDDLRSGQNRCEPIAAKIGNKSQEGLFIETDRTFAAGSIIRVKLVPLDNDRSKSACRVQDCQVVWHRKFDNGTPRFGIGVKILRRYVQADVLTSSFP